MGANIPGGNFLGGNFPVGIFQGWEFDGWEFSRGGGGGVFLEPKAISYPFLITFLIQLKKC